MKRMALMFALTLALVIAGGIGNEVLSSQHVKILLRTDLAGVEGKEGILAIVKIAPGVTGGKHYHPGHAFLYVLEGSVTLVLEGKPEVALKRGDAFHMPAKQVHFPKTSTESVKLLVSRVHVKGRPVAVKVSK